jgi:acetylornithine deacetylase/succinyl-diaminopimelate desuccinylase-like protein
MPMSVSSDTEFLDFFRRLLGIPAENPGGTTVGVAEFVASWLGQAGIRVAIAEPKAGYPNLWASVGVAAAERHLTLCGHMDTFAVGDAAKWTHDPFGAEISEGLVYGRGACAARGGLASMLWAFREVARRGLPQGRRLTLIAASDTESGGAWGVGSLVRTAPEVVGTACLLGEPEGTSAIRIGEKGKAQFELRTEGDSYSAALSSGGGAIALLARALVALERLPTLESSVPSEVADIIAEMGTYSRNSQEQGLTWLLRRPSLNAGVIEGGTKVNLAPARARALVDVRSPFGMSTNELFAHARRLLTEAGCDGVKLSPIEPVIEWSVTSPDEPFVVTAADAVERITGSRPTLSLGFASTDARYFRPLGVPCIVYGPTPHNVGAPDESVAVAEMETVVRVHQEIISDYLTAAASPTVSTDASRVAQVGDS